MLITPCCEPVEYKILQCIHPRMTLSPQESQNYLNLEKGCEGERKFEVLLEYHLSEGLILNDLLLEKNNTVFQIDSLVISSKKIYLFEVKNYEGDFYVENDNWFTIKNIEIKNPLDQLKRSESLLRRLLHDLKPNFPIESYVIFINPQFTLYQAPMNLPIILPTQLNHFIKKVNMTSSKLNESHSKLAEQLLSLHITESPYTRISVYDYDQLQKGITCASCNSLLTSFKENKLVCEACGSKEKIELAIMRSVEQIQFLFPERKITINAVQEWCRVIESKKTIRRILTKNLKLMFQGKLSYYVFPDGSHQ
jgi:Nuclease-related domain